MKKIALTMLAGLALLCSCEKNLSDDGLAMKHDVVPGTNVKESQLEKKMYTEAGFMELMNGRCYKRIAVYDCYKKRGDTYYVIMHEEGDGEYCFNILEHCEGCGRDIRLFKEDELALLCGSIGNELTRLYDYSFVKQKLVYGGNREAVIFVNDEYLITLNDLFWDSSYDAGAMFSRTVYQRTEVSDWYPGDTIDLRGYFD